MRRSFPAFAGWAAALWVSAAVSHSLAEPPPAPPPAEIPVRNFLAGRVTASAYVFPGTRFPMLNFAPPQAADLYLGRHIVRTTYYDAALQPVTEPKKPGAYAAIVDFLPDHGRPTRRLVTLFRNANDFAMGERCDLYHPEGLMRWSGLSFPQLQRSGELLATYCQNQPMEALAKNPGMARILAGIARMPEDKQPVRKNNDAFAQERQWWVEIKRRVSGAEKKWPGPFTAPHPGEGAAAPTIHEGTLAEAGMNADAAEKIEAVCKQWAADSDQSFAVCVARHGVIVLSNAYGSREGHPMLKTDKSWMASITKCFSATCMMLLVDQGLVSLDDPVEKFLPQFKGIAVPKPLTIRHLYTHTSGLALWPPWGDDQSDLEDEAAECYPYLKVGAAWTYGGQGNSLGCKIVETITGEAMPFFYLHHVLEPLGMDHTDVLGAHADMQSTPLDMARFGQMLLNRGRYGNLQFMRPETFDQMLPQKLTAVLGPDATKSFGIGMDGEVGSGKFGHGAASSATFSVDAKRDLVVVMCRNTAGKNWDKYNGKFWDAITAGISPSP